MMEAIISYLLADAPSAVLLLGAIVYATYFITKKIEEEKYRIKSIETQGKDLAVKIDAIDKKIDATDKKLTDKIDAIDKKLTDKIEATDKKLTDKIDATDKKIGAIEEKMIDIIVAVNTISSYLGLKSKQKLPSDVNIGLSPEELTPLGEEILNVSGGKKYVDENLASLIEELESKNPKSGLDVDSFSFWLLMRHAQLDGFIHIKNYIFQNPYYPNPKSPKEPFSLDLEFICQVMAIYLRNKYCEKYPSLKTAL